MDESRNKQLLKRSGKALHASVERVDPSTRLALARVRQEALATAERSAHRRSPYLVPLVGVSAVLLFIIAAVLGRAPPKHAPDADWAIEALAPVEVEILAVEESYELYDKLEFYHWLSVDRRRG